MNFMEYVCRGIVRSEDAICRLNKRVGKLAKYARNTNTAVICIGIGTILLCSVVWMQDDEIKALREQVGYLRSEVADTTKEAETESQEGTTTEEQTQQEGA